METSRNRGVRTGVSDESDLCRTRNKKTYSAENRTQFYQ